MDPPRQKELIYQHEGVMFVLVVLKNGKTTSSEEVMKAFLPDPHFWNARAFWESVSGRRRRVWLEEVIRERAGLVLVLSGSS